MDTRVLLDELREHDPWTLAMVLDDLPPSVCRALLDAMRDGMLDPDAAPRYDELELLPHQEPPDGPWTYWSLIGGRGTGKTSGASAEMYRHAMFDPPCIPGVPGGHRLALIAPTLGDASRAVNAPGGLRSLDPDVREVTRKGGTVVEFANGVTLSEYGAHGKDDVERLRSGGNTCRVWCEELVAWRQLGYENDAWDLMRTGLRLGPHPRVIVSTTPKPIPKLRELVEAAFDPDQSRYAMTHGTTFDNPHLADEYVDELRELYVGTRLEAQELLGRLLGEVVGALWTELLLSETRREPDRVPRLERVVVGVDPAFSEEEGSDETGIVVAGRGRVETSGRVEAFVLDDVSGSYGAHSWPAKAVEAYHRHNAYAIVAESNLGGRDFIRRSIHAVDPDVNVKTVHAREGKRTRAEPVALLYDQQRAHHVGTLALLEAELTSWVPGDRSPNRLDALVWALTHVSEGMTLATAKASSPAGKGRVPGRSSARR